MSTVNVGSLNVSGSNTPRKRMIIFRQPLTPEEAKVISKRYTDRTGQPITVLSGGRDFCLYETDGTRMYPPVFSATRVVPALIGLVFSVAALLLSSAALALVLLQLP